MYSRPIQLVNQIETLQTECRQLQERLVTTDYAQQENNVEQLFQQDRLALKQLQEAVEKLQLVIDEEEDETQRHKLRQVAETNKELLSQLQKQHRLELLRWKKWNEQHQRQILLEEQKLRRRRKPSNSPEEELPDSLNTKIQSSLQNTKQVLTSQVHVTNNNLERLRKDEQTLKATQTQQQSYSEYMFQGGQQLRNMTRKKRESHWKLIASFVLFLLVCTFIVYQRLEHSSWFGTTRVVKQTVVVTFHGVYIGMRYLWNFIIHCIFSIWELTKYLWLVWQRQRKLQHNSQHAILENTSRNETEQVKDEDSIVFPTSLISFTLPIENVSHAMESNVVAKDTAVPEEVYWIKNEKEEDDETIRVLPNEEEVEEIQPIKDSVDIPNDWQEEEEVYASDLNEVLYNGTSKVSECIKEESTMDNQSNEMDAYVPKEEMINEEDFFTQASRNDWDHMEESVVEDNVSPQQDNRIVDTLEM